MRQRSSLDFGWRFQLGDKGKISLDLHRSWFAKAAGAAGAAATDFDDSSWLPVDIPHDWAIDLPYDRTGEESLGYIFHGFKPIGPQLPETSIGWYRCHFNIPAEHIGKRLTIEFDGIYRDSIVWLNGHYLGRHMSGYTSFTYDITDVANYDGKNVLVVRADSTHYEGWWYEGAGIHRHVWLTKTSQLHLAPSGTFITSEIDRSAARLTVSTKVTNDSDHSAVCTITSTILDVDGREVAAEDTPSSPIHAWQQTEFVQTFTIDNPALWSPDSPNLYHLHTTVRDGSVTTDKYETTFGIRSIHFDPDKGFFLNGKHTILKGLCSHPDHAGVGAAIPDRLHEYRLEKLKEMGANAVRSPHCCPAKEWLDACDRLGLLVVDETRFFGSSKECLTQLESMIIRDRNHPSIIMWSLGNEEFIQSSEVSTRIGTTMKRLVKQLDHTRPTTFGANNDDTDTGINSVVDVRGWNYMYHEGVDEYHVLHPRQPIVVLEEASTLCTRGIYHDDAENCYVSAYDDLPEHLRGSNVWMTAERWWKYCVKRPFLAGGFVWTAFDYRGEPTPYWRWPCIGSHFGIMDACGFPKDNYYYYQAWWSNQIVLHILPHWNWPGKEGQEIDVRCFSNCEAVELFINRRSLGRKEMPRNSHLQWMVKYESGVLKAWGYKGKKVVVTSAAETSGPGSTLKLVPNLQQISTDRHDVVVVDVAVVDNHGRTVPTARNEIWFVISGNARIIGVGNGDPISHEPDHALRRRAFNGLCQVILQSLPGDKPVKLKASSYGLLDNRITLERNKADLASRKMNETASTDNKS